MIVTIISDLEKLIPPLSQEEYEGLKQDILKNGQRIPIDVGYIPREDFRGHFIIDGHNRLAICDEFNIKTVFVDKPKEFDSLDEVKIWMIDNQLRRRNINDWQKVQLLEEKRRLIQGMQGKRTDLTSAPFGAEVVSPRDKVIEELGISKGTAARGKFVLDHGSADIKEKLDKNEITIGRAYRLTKQEELKSNLSTQSNQTIAGKYKVIYADPPWQYDFVFALRS